MDCDNDADTKTNGKRHVYEGGKLTVGIHPSTLPDPNKPALETVVPKPGTPEMKDMNRTEQASGAGSPSGTDSKAGVQNGEAIHYKKAIDDLSKPSALRGHSNEKTSPVLK
ncbi:MAG: hypothetical protein IPH84_20450 [Bacteroidales bacterium]|nr:hypothetical protein [Bacteroidales bacterium]